MTHLSLWEYYDAFGVLCDQIGLDKERRQPVRAPDGRFLDAVPDVSGTIYYFLTPIETWFIRDN